MTGSKTDSMMNPAASSTIGSMMKELISVLHDGGHTLVVRNNTVRTFSERGVSDLYRLLREEPEFLDGASIADKVVGKAAAALMVLGGVKELHTGVISEHALELFRRHDIRVSYDCVVPYIINRTRTGWCPMETRCKDCYSAEECLTEIEDFMNSKR